MFYFQQYFGVMFPLGSSFMYILITELIFFSCFGFASETELKVLKSSWNVFYKYTHALFYLTTFWCNELS